MRVKVTIEDIGRAKLYKQMGFLPSRTCPIALALRRKKKGEFAVGSSSFGKGEDRGWKLPPEASEFIAAFDAGEKVEPIEFIATRWASE